MGKEFSVGWLDQRAIYASKIDANPYHPRNYLRRAICFERLEYPDLAAGDAYRALLLTDELLDDAEEFHDQAVEALLNAAGGDSTDGLCAEELDDKITTEVSAQHAPIGDSDETEDPPWYEAIANQYARQSYEILIRTLMACGDLKSAFNFSERCLKVFPTHGLVQRLQQSMLQEHYQKRSKEDPSWDESKFIPREGLPGIGSVRREIYPWNDLEPNRFADSSISFLNAEIKKVAPKCEVRAVDLPLLNPSTDEEPTQKDDLDDRKLKTIRQLGIFATSDISPHETVLLEPSILTANNRDLDPLCDACSSPLPPMSPSSPLPTCPSCTDIYFCSTTCFDRAQQLYHPAICGITDHETLAKDPTPAAAASSLYLLLIARTIAMAETQDNHPLLLPQTKFLWGDFTPPEHRKRTLPFSFDTNIAGPIHILTKMDINIYAPSTLEKYDTWVLNTLFAKFRGVANANMNPVIRRPDVAAVHPLWSLANHSCAPNLRWEWSVAANGRGGGERKQGTMGFAARGGEEVVRWGGKGEGDLRCGIRKGEEVLNHYCDVQLSVKERREWAAGALGGMCVCARCMWEEREEKEKERREGEARECSSAEH